MAAIQLAGMMRLHNTTLLVMAIVPLVTFGFYPVARLARTRQSIQRQ
jgi:hypothetical protein